MSLTTALQVPKPFRHKVDDHGPEDPQPLPLVPILCWLTVAFALLIVGTHLGARYALLFMVYAVTAQTTRLPRALPVTAGLSVLFAALTLVASSTPVPTRLPAAPKPSHRTHHGRKPASTAKKPAHESAVNVLNNPYATNP